VAVSNRIRRATRSHTPLPSRPELQSRVPALPQSQRRQIQVICPFSGGPDEQRYTKSATLTSIHQTRQPRTKSTTNPNLPTRQATAPGWASVRKLALLLGAYRLLVLWSGWHIRSGNIDGFHLETVRLQTPATRNLRNIIVNLP